jgi:hypothetical protein
MVGGVLSRLVGVERGLSCVVVSIDHVRPFSAAVAATHCGGLG